MSWPTIFANLAAGNQPLALFDAMFNQVAQMVAIPSTATGANAITLNPIGNAPALTAYQNFSSFRFLAAANSTGLITAGYQALAVLPVYLNDGATQAGSGATIAGEEYVLVFAQSLNAGGGGFFLEQAAIPALAMTPQVFTAAGASGTYTTPAGAAWLEVEVVGAGGGGAGSGTGAGNGGNGGASSFGASIGASGGTGGTSSGVGGAGGLGTGGTFNTFGGQGGAAQAGSTAAGGAGGVSYYGGGSGTSLSGQGGGAAAAPGSGGGGGAGSTTSGFSAPGGGAGGWNRTIIANPSPTYAYVAGAAGTAGAAGASGQAGGVGQLGAILVIAHFR